MKRRLLHHLAEAVSNVLSPPAVFGALGLLLAISPATAAPFWPALGWGVLHGVLASLIPVAYIVYLLKTGAIGDLHMRRRQERNRPFVLGVSTAFATWILLTLFDAPQTFQRLALFDVTLLVLLGIVNVWWQISTHGAAIVGAVTISGVVFGLPVAIWASPLVALVAWARLYLGRHSVNQIIAGSAVGALMAIAMFIAL
jgi:membrane-associated phospholipid phosphatase